MSDIQSGNIQSNKLIALDCHDVPFNPTIAEFASFLTRLNRYNFPKEIKEIASKLREADKHFRVAKTQFKLAQEQERLGAISKDELEKARNKFETCSSKVGKLFAQTKQEYLSWYDKNVPESLKNAWVVLSSTDTDIKNLHGWLTTHTYDVIKHEIVPIKD